MSRPTTTWPVSTDPVDIGTSITVFDSLTGIDGGPGAQLDWIRTRAADFTIEFRSSGMPDSVVTCDLVTLPYPTKFGLFRAAATPAPFLSITNRMLVIRWTDTSGRRRTLLFEPSDVDLGAQNDSRFLQFFPSSELTAHWISPGTRPTVSHGAITHGTTITRQWSAS